MSSMGDADALDRDGIEPVRRSEEMEFTAASFSVCNEAVRFDLNDVLDFFVARVCFGMEKSSSSWSSLST